MTSDHEKQSDAAPDDTVTTEKKRAVPRALILLYAMGAAMIHRCQSPMPQENGDISVFRLLYVSMTVLFGASFCYSLVY